MTWPIAFEDVERARDRIRPHLAPTPLRPYPPLDAEVGHGIRVLVKHENHNPTNAFKVRNALAALTALSPEERLRGVLAASRGNHGLGLAWAGARLGVPVTVVVPHGNSPEKNAGIRGFGARLLEEGRDYDEAAAVAEELARKEGVHLVHSTNNRDVLAGASTIGLEILEERKDLTALVIAVGGGSQAVGAITVARALNPSVRVFGVQAENASALHESWRLGRIVTHASADTFADGLATRTAYPLTFEALREGLSGFVTVTEPALAEAVRLLLRTTHNLAEGAGAAGLAGVLALRETLAGGVVGVILSGANIDAEPLRRVLAREI